MISCINVVTFSSLKGLIIGCNYAELEAFFTLRVMTGQYFWVPPCHLITAIVSSFRLTTALIACTIDRRLLQQYCYKDIPPASPTIGRSLVHIMHFKSYTTNPCYQYQHLVFSDIKIGNKPLRSFFYRRLQSLTKRQQKKKENIS